MIELREKCLRALADFLHPHLDCGFAGLISTRPVKRLLLFTATNLYHDWYHYLVRVPKIFVVGLTRLNFMTDIHNDSTDESGAEYHMT
jgi:hypothetical protein